MGSRVGNGGLTNTNTNLKMPSHSEFDDEKQKEKMLQEWLDQNQYTRKGILRYEAIFGRTYVSVGGETTTKDFVERLDLKPGMKVLDIGCGIGGSAFYMARNYGVDVYGIDLAQNMIAIAKEKRETKTAGIRHRTQFHVDDATVMDYPESFYDLVYSRDTILHIEDKLSLFKLFHKTLKPGGSLFITDYCKGDVPAHSAEFTKYVAQRGYVLKTVKQYGDLLKKAGFGRVEAVDVTKYFIEVSTNELNKYTKMKDQVLEEFEESDFNHIVSGWKEKIARAKSGDQAWGMFVAKKLYS